MAENKTTAKPRLQNLENLFKLNDGINPLEKVVPIIQIQPARREVISVAIKQLTPFKGHPFRLYNGERLDDMVASVKINGVLVPIIVRRVTDILEILSGHNRVEAAKLAGLTEVPTIVYENISDADAMVYVVETNLIQRSFSDMCHSEKAAVIALHHSKMFSQGKRNDILKQLDMLENPYEFRENATLRQVGKKLHSDLRVAEMYSLSPKTISRYLRIQQLIPTFKSQLDNDEIAFVAAVTLSFIKEDEQVLIANCMEQNDLSLDIKKADMLRKFSEKNSLDGDTIIHILSGAMAHKPNRTPTVKISKTVYTKYFTPNQSAREVQAIVEKALELYFDQH